MASTGAATDFLYLYGVILVEELQTKEVPSIMGIDGKAVSDVFYKRIAACYTPVNAQTFSQQQIELQLKDPDWLKDKAFHHHEIISEIHKNFTILPMSFCTVFQKMENLEAILKNQYNEILEKLHSLKDQQEWNLKVYYNTEKILNYINLHNPTVMDLKEKIPTMPKGKQFIMRKKLEQLISSQVELELAKWWQEISDELAFYVTTANLRKIWGREVTERKDEMMVNCDFLIAKETANLFFHKMKDLEKKYAEFGCGFQLTGPWPPYHFSKMAKETL
ncbi:GvpL/GvpF family gas vesicle protein [Neobacillus cucumis]|uniref:GvpL/GvpF family gas vesicle protein n=1 Tax=Neobacillus cucumis TaxID=1740721 RepID=UPI002E1E0F13|nr:GvpL/GvpF family gas vesicle protein [Neobacillus cucumis]